MQPRLLQLRRLVIGEAGRFPELGRIVLRARPGAHDRGAGEPRSSASPRAARCELDDPELAAAHFNWLVMSIPLNRAMLLGDDETAAAGRARPLRRRRRARRSSPPTAVPAPDSVPAVETERFFVTAQDGRRLEVNAAAPPTAGR